MEAINGVTFIDWACACAHTAQGMSEEDILKVLGIESPVWQQTNEAWGGKLGDIMANDINMATKYGEVFANPNQGKFANVEQKGADDSTLDAIAPDYDTYTKILMHQSIASKYGIDPATVLQSYGLDLGSWGKLNMKYMNDGINSVAFDDPDYNSKMKVFTDMEKKWKKHWKKHYKDEAVDLSDDIDF